MTDTTPAPIGEDALREALWICVEHNALHFGETHNTVVQGRAALAGAAPAAQEDALNTIAAMFHSAEEIEGPDGLAMMVDMSVWNDALDAFDEISGDEMEPAQPPAGIWVPTELAERVQETMGEFLMDHGWRQQDMDTSDEFGALLAVATKAAPASQDADDAI